MEEPPATPTKDGHVIILTRLNGDAFAVNPDLLERVEATPDTVLTLLDGTKYVVEEPVEQVIDEVRAFRASIIVASRRMHLQPGDPGEGTTVAPAVPLRPVGRH